jgi:hypothetical protein
MKAQLSFKGNREWQFFFVRHVHVPNFRRVARHIKGVDGELLF